MFHSLCYPTIVQVCFIQQCSSPKGGPPCLIGFSHSKEWAFQPSQPSFNSRVKSHFIFAILFYFFKLTQSNTELFSSWKSPRVSLRAQSGQQLKYCSCYEAVTQLWWSCDIFEAGTELWWSCDIFEAGCSCWTSGSLCLALFIDFPLDLLYLLLIISLINLLNIPSLCSCIRAVAKMCVRACVCACVRVCVHHTI